MFQNKTLSVLLLVIIAFAATSCTKSKFSIASSSLAPAQDVKSKDVPKDDDSQPACNLNTHELFQAQCLTKCSTNQVRNSQGQCTTQNTEPTCNPITHEIWNSACVARCSSNQSRNSQGQCFTPPVIIQCTSEQEIVNNQCVTKCGPHQIRTNGVCTNRRFPEACSNAIIVEGTKSCEYINAQMQTSCGSCNALRCNTGYAFNPNNYSCTPIDYGSCIIEPGDYEWSESVSTYHCKSKVQSRISLNVGQEYVIDSIVPGVTLGTMKFKCKEVDTQIQANNNNAVYKVKRLHYESPHGDMYATLSEANTRFQSSFSGVCKRDESCSPTLGMYQSNQYGGFSLGFQFSNSTQFFSGSAVHKCVDDGQGNTYRVHFRCNGNAYPTSAQSAAWEVASFTPETCSPDAPQVALGGSSYQSLYRLPGADQSKKVGIGPNCQAYYCSTNNSSRGLTVGGANFISMVGGNGCYKIQTTDTLTVSFSSGAPETRRYSCNNGILTATDL